MTNRGEDHHLSDEYLSCDEEDDVQVKFFTKESSIKLCFLKNQRYSIPIRLLNLIIKTLPCILYIIQVICDNPLSIEGCCHICENHTSTKHDITDTDITNVHWERLIFVNRKHGLWLAQIVCSILSLLQMVFTACLSQKGSLRRLSFVIDVFIEFLNSFPFIISIFFSHSLRCLFIPTFLNCWLAKSQFENVLGDLNRVFQRTPPIVFHRVMKVISSTFCLIFTSVCGFQHLQRGGYRHLNLFESLWFVVVTFSTVGFGDYKPDIWLSQAFMIVMIVVSLIVIPLELEKLVHVWLERNKQGGTYSQYRSKREDHVILCTTSLKSDVILDFLNEFYAHQRLQNYYVCLLSPCELDTTVKIALQMPIWAQRVIYIQGSALKDIDLVRCRIQDSKACFLLAPTSYKDSNVADQHTILCSWAIRDFAPQCPQFLQLYRPENIMHVEFAEHVVCLDEFKYALLGNNALIPGISTLVTLLIHTSKGHEGQFSSEEWQRVYGKCSGNEVYNIQLKDSKFFKEYESKSFSHTSYHAYKKYGVNLIAVSLANTNDIQLNPGPHHTMSSNDMCFYLFVTEEDNSSVIENHQQRQCANPNRNGTAGRSMVDIEMGPNIVDSPSPCSIKKFVYPKDSRDLRDSSDVDQYVLDRPRMPYIGAGSCLCHLSSDKREVCCLQLLEPCQHCHHQSIVDYKWNCKSLIVCADTANLGLYNIIIPLRSYWIAVAVLKPIILLVRIQPDRHFLESISYFPLVYWIVGSCENADDLLRAGILLSDQVVVISGEGNVSMTHEDTLTDSKTIFAVQQIYRLFPHVNILTEISKSSNMKFLQFSPDDKCSQYISKLEKKERARGSQISYLFRLPFASGNVFSTNMLDTLLYQAFVKPELIGFLRLLLGIDQSCGSGHLTCYKLTENDISTIKCYGNLYKKFVRNTYNVPIGIYRTIRRDLTNCKNTNQTLKNKDKSEVSHLVNNRIASLHIPFMDYDHKEMTHHRTSFVLINPSYNQNLQKEDIIYLLCPPSEVRSNNNGNQSHVCNNLHLRDDSESSFVNGSTNNKANDRKPNYCTAVSIDDSIEKEEPESESIPLVTNTNRN